MKAVPLLFGTPGNPGCLDAFEPLDECHRETIRMLTELEALVARIETVGIDCHARELAETLDRYFSQDLKQHHLDEETSVFPLLAESSDAQTVQAVGRLIQDHAWLRADWRVLSPLIRAVAANQSWVDVNVLRDGVEVFCALSRDHIALEESLIYPQARIRMLESIRREMRRVMVTRR
jgi:iron-sulfur cluster repair protein YtfE (RIC family)